MKFDPEIRHRRSIRLANYDYSKAGFYFVTLCTYQKQYLFGEIINDEMQLNQIGKVVKQEWLRSATIRKEVELDEWIVMPNHLHGIIIINNIYEEKMYEYQSAHSNQGASLAPLHRKPKSLSSFMAGFKSAVTKKVRLMCEISDFVVWQRSFYESIIKDDIHLDNARLYIQNNPFNWHQDPEKLSDNINLIDVPF